MRKEISCHVNLDVGFFFFSPSMSTYFVLLIITNYKRTRKQLFPISSVVISLATGEKNFPTFNCITEIFRKICDRFTNILVYPMLLSVQAKETLQNLVLICWKSSRI